MDGRPPSGLRLCRPSSTQPPEAGACSAQPATIDCMYVMAGELGLPASACAHSTLYIAEQLVTIDRAACNMHDDDVGRHG